MSSSTRREHRRRRRTWDQLDSDNQVRYRRTQDTDELLSAYDALVHLHQRRWGQCALPSDPASGTDDVRWRDVLRRCGSDTAFIATLGLGGQEIVAAQLCLYRGRQAWSVMPAMEPDHAHLAPGHAMLRYLADDLSAHGFRFLDLGRTAPGQHSYKAQYAPQWTSTLSAASAPEAAALA
ncbi:GNAT family N-acetyltransferase [Streptomyces hygroscopicus]|uniref:GNAT family N-acetyltransferase n=1 Tax=Streptomyces hygroscopicus TaxID=1912 RepID=UPI001FCBABD7|nr:GNAT family N-acetyltransferase [Streptomyces hygroscopicus]